MPRKCSRRREKEITETKTRKQSGEHHQSAKSAQIKASNHAMNPSKEDADKNKYKKKNSPV